MDLLIHLNGKKIFESLLWREDLLLLTEKNQKVKVKKIKSNCYCKKYNIYYSVTIKIRKK